MNSNLNCNRRLVIVSPGFNCSDTIDLWYNSLKVQTYPNWIAIAIDDGTPSSKLMSKLEKISKLDNRVVAYKSTDKLYQLGSWYNVINNHIPDLPLIKPDDIIIYHDLDDWFGNKFVLEKTIKEYLYRDIKCLTARNFQLSDYYNHDAAMYTDRQQLIDATCHQFSLFSYEARLFQDLPEWYFKTTEGEFLEVCGDFLITLPILYQAGPHHHHHMFEDNWIIYNNIRLECDDNKMKDGYTLHEITAVDVVRRFHKLLPSLIKY